jgi:hypothetical protein
MVRIQLIEPQKGWLDVAEGTTFPINISASDIRDVGSRSGSYSKTVILAGTENNNNLLNYYFDVNIQAGTFDVGKIQKCVVYENDEVILDKAVIRLLSVSEVLGNVQYEAQVLGDTADLFTRINDKFLTDIDFTDLNHVYNSANVVATFNNTNADKYAYLMPYSTESEYSLQQFKPAIYAKTYFDRIFNQAGFRYTTFRMFDFEKLIVPYNGDELKISERDLKQLEVIATKASTTVSTSRTSGKDIDVTQTFVGFTEVKDDENIYNATSNAYNSPVNTLPYSGTINYEITGQLDFRFNNTSGEDVKIYSIGGFPPAELDVTYNYGLELVFFKNGVEHQVFPIDTAILKSPVSNRYIIPSGNNSVKTVPLNIIAGVKDIEENDLVEISLRMKITADQSWSYVMVTSNSVTSVTSNIVLTDFRQRIIPSPFNLSSGYEMDMNKVVPQGIKQSDFVKSVMRMYNAYIVADDNDDTLLKILPRDEYFDLGGTKDWTNKIDLSKERTITFIPELTTKEVMFTYKPDDKDVVNDGYQKATNSVYGQQLFIYSNQYARGRDTQELIFSPTPHGLTPFGAYLPFINGFAPKCNIRILIHSGTATCQTFKILDYGTTGTTSTTYPRMMHLNNPTRPTSDINFGICDFYFYPLNYFTPNTLFNRYYLRQLNQINKGKLMSAYFQLNATDIRTIKLNDKIKVGNSLWNINKIIDYNANGNEVTKVELISVDDGQRVAPKVQPPATDTPFGSPPTTNNNPPNTPPTTRRNQIVQSYEKQTTEFTNLVYGDNNDVQGRGNYVVGNNVRLIGNNNEVLASNVTLQGDDRVITESTNNRVVLPYRSIICYIEQAASETPTPFFFEGSELGVPLIKFGVGYYYFDFTNVSGNIYLPNTLDNNPVVFQTVANDVTDIRYYISVFLEDANTVSVLIKDDTDTFVELSDINTGKKLYLPEIRIYD